MALEYGFSLPLEEGLLYVSKESSIVTADGVVPREIASTDKGIVALLVRPRLLATTSVPASVHPVAPVSLLLSTLTDGFHGFCAVLEEEEEGVDVIFCRSECMQSKQRKL